MLQYFIKQWDSEFFGISIAELSGSYDPAALYSAMRTMALDNIRLAYWKVQPADAVSVAAAEAAQLYLGDVKITFQSSTQDLPDQATEYKPEIHDGPITDACIALALESGQYSRFRKDKKFPAGSYEKLYTTWIQRSFTKEMAKEIFVVKEKQNIIAIVTVDALTDHSEIGILAVRKDFRRQGIGKDLVYASRCWARDHDCRIAKVITQKENTAACSLYSACGYTIEKEELVYHIWL